MEDYKIRKSTVAGKFYPAENNVLLETLAHLFRCAQPCISKYTRALIVPHAGYEFSGVVAASAYQQIDAFQQYDNIFIIGSSHMLSYAGVSVCKFDYYETPLGVVPVNTQVVEALQSSNDFITYIPQAHESEHCIDVQLPFLQYHLKSDFKIVPIILGGKNPKTPKMLASVLQPYFTPNNLFIISSDFSHYPEYTDAQRIDRETIDAICINNPELFMDILDKHAALDIDNLVSDMCGWHAALTLLYLTSKTTMFEYSKIEYRNSGDSIVGNKQRVVGYAAIIVEQRGSGNLFLSNEAKDQLLIIARKTLDEHITLGNIPAVNSEELFPELFYNCGAFVSLHIGNRLRGCIGNFAEDIPLFEMVRNLTIAAATADSRFSEIMPDELDEIDIEISVLTPRRKINSIQEIELGKHGIYMVKDLKSGTLLPHVAIHAKWNVEEYLGYCARDKAHIGWSGWKDADLYIYEAIVFSESMSYSLGC